MLKASVEESEVAMTAEQLAIIVKSTFEEGDVNRDGFIDQGEYRAMVQANPSMLANMTLDFRKVIEMRAEEEVKSRGRTSVGSKG